MDPPPDYGEGSYKGSARLTGKKAVITGADSGIGRAVALAFAREGADILVSYYSEHEDARETQRLVESAGRKCLLAAGDIKDSEHCRALIAKAAEGFGQIDILVNNAAHQASFDSVEEISDEEWDVTFRTNIHAMFYLTKAAAAYAPRRRDHQYDLGQRRLSEPPATRLRNDKRSNSKFYRRARTTAR